MHIKTVIVDGFKSYATRTVIDGFDRRFNAITGLNGSGKSNILDAVCFVLGISNLSQVRAGNLNELVYKQGQAGVTKASVTIIFDNADRQHSPVGYEECTEITVTRQVVIGGRHKYLVNGHTAQLSRVQNLFHSVQLNVNNPHFLIMQGRITKVINMKPEEVLGMLAEAAGTRMFEEKSAAAQKTIEKKDAKVAEIDRALAEEIAPTLDKLRGEKGQFMQFAAGRAEIDRLARFCTAADFQAARRRRDASAEAVATVEAERMALQEELEKLQAQLLSFEEEAKAARALADGQSSGVLKARLDEADALERDLAKRAAAMAHKQEAAERERAGARAHRQAAEALDADGEGAAGPSVEAARAAADSAQAEHDAAAVDLHRKEATLEAQIGVGANATANTLEAQEQQAAAEQTSAASAAKQAALRAKHVRADLAAAEKKLKAAAREGEAIEHELADLATRESSVRERTRALAYDEGRAAEAAKEHHAAETAAADLRTRADTLAARLDGARFKYAKPSASFDPAAVKGTVVDLVRVRDPERFATALEVIGGARLHHVVVDTDVTAKALLEKGLLLRRTTFVPLNRVVPRTVPAAKVAAAQRAVGADKVWSPLALLESDAVVKGAVEYVFGSALVCADAVTAKSIAFDPAIGVACVTLEGDMFNPSGTLTGGARPPAGGGLLGRMEALRQLREKADEAERVARDLAARVEQGVAAADEAARLDEELQLTQQAQQLARERMDASAYGQLRSTRDALADEAKAVDKARDDAVESEKRAKGRVLELKRQIAAFATDKDAQLRKLKKEVAEGKKALAKLAERAAEARTVSERSVLRQASAADERASLLEQAAAADRDAAAAEAEAAELEAALSADRQRHAALEATLAAERGRLQEHADREAGATAAAARAAASATDAKLEIKKVDHRLSRARKDADAARTACEDLCDKHPWIPKEEHLFGQAGTDFDFGARDPAHAASELRRTQADHEALSKRVNKKALAMFERAEAEHDDLTRKKEIIAQDRDKIGKAITELDQKKRDAVEKTWRKVNVDFGAIFSTLLPNSNAKLEPPAGQTIHDGLCIHVALGDVWKTSLLELSGGQRSLVALSLVLALLLFKPAPLYILDEVDAALDLSHTQNIGAMIRKHFMQSQFLVVSLKEGMFNNANVIFRTKFVDGVSTVSRTVVNGSDQTAQDDADKSRPKAPSGIKGKTARRPALTMMN